MGESSVNNWALGIETSNPAATESDAAETRRAPAVAAAVVQGDGTLGPVEIEPLAPTGRHDDDLIPAIDRLTTRLGLRATDLKRVCVSIGPGGFTGLRVAVATAKMLHEVTGCEVAPVPSALVAAHDLREADAPAAMCLASKRGTAHVTLVFAGGSSRELGVIDEDAFASVCAHEAVKAIIADHHLPEGWARATELLTRRDPAFCAGACLRLGMSCLPVDAVQLIPAYPREPEAVTRWKSRAVGE
ncbi:MAG: tRNA (adenosine(37)-N6)-threonylcarbamoyltransferase complex dimerization subunit type 1 TsaB [Planctomycetota bacterium]